MKKYSQVFADVADFLNQDNWIKGTSFLLVDGKIKCSAFGAVKASTVPAIGRILVENNTLSLAVETINVIANLGPKIHAFTSPNDGLRAFITNAWNVRKAWDQRDPSIRGTHTVLNWDSGTMEATYLMGMVGLTDNHHDHPATTLDEIKGKLLQAAAIAHELEV